MRESIGGAWLFGIVITFIFMFSGFLAYSISYTKAFNVKNEVVNIIEQATGLHGWSDTTSVITPDNQLQNTARDKIIKTIKNTGYNYDVTSNIPCQSSDGSYGTKLNKSGVCIIKYCSANSINEELNRRSYVHYKVTTYIALKLPVLEITFKIPISGETTTITTDNSGFYCGDEQNAHTLDWN